MAENDNDKLPSYVDDEEKEGGLFNRMYTTLVVLAAVGFFALFWYGYKNGNDTVSDKDVEIITADKTPVKEAPVNPGGMDIPNQDKTVYGLINGGRVEKSTAEHVLPSPEEPVKRAGDSETWMSDEEKSKLEKDETAAAKTQNAPVVAETPAASPATAKPEQFNPKTHAPETPAETTSADTTKTANAEVAPASTTAPAFVAATPKTAPAVKAEATAEQDTDDSETPKASAEKPKPVPATVSHGKGARAQLGAFKSEDEAKGEWTKIARRFASAGAKEHYILRADVSGKGVFYRLQVGPFANAQQAQAFCGELAAKKQGCILARGK